MDEILQQIEQIFLSVEDVKKQMKYDVQLFKTNLDTIVAGNKELNQTPQQKKKVKRLSIIIDSEENGKNASEISLKEDCKNVGNDNIEDSAENHRPSRAAKLKVESMKQPTLREKLRRPGADDSISALKTVPKHSGINGEAVKVKTRTTTSNYRSSNHSAKRSSNEDDKKDETQNDIKKIDESVLIVPNGEVLVVDLSEDESDKIMPPPSEIPKKKVNAKPKQSEGSEISTRSLRLRIKKEKLSVEKQAENATISVANEGELVSEATDRQIEKDDLLIAECKVEVEKEVVAKANTKKTKKGKKALKCMPIKEEKPDENEPKEIGKRVTRNKEKDKPLSMESVYEDAVADDIGKPSLNIEPQQSIPRVTPVVVIEKLKTSDINKTNTKTSTEMPADATFVSAKDIPVPETDTTFVTSSCPQQTFVMDTNNLSNDLDRNKTQIISTNQAKDIDTTFSINNETFQTQPADQNHNKKQQNDVMRSSIMTEEDFVDELMPPPQPASAKSKPNKELFNPCVQSPVKKKVEAFEKHAHAAASPLIQRQTRTKTKAKENKDPETPNILTKLVTPSLLKRDVGKLFTPTLQSNLTPTIGTLQATKYLASSTSKLTQLHKSSAKSSTISKTQSLSRDNSVEDVKRGGYSKLQQLADEKKKRDLKQQLAAQKREAKEKERADKLKKAMQEREEKLRRKAQEVEQKKQLEEINKNLKLQEEKRELQKRVERKQLEMEMAEAARKEREMLDNMKIQKAKEELQQKLLHNQKLLEQKKAKNVGKQGLKYDFNLLNSDDSTDDEGKTSSKRPQPPVWSKSSIRQLFIERQAHLNTKIIDSFFSVQPMTPDLKEIFPAIDPRYLKRNSSVFWNTPPRYSQLPKY